MYLIQCDIQTDLLKIKVDLHLDLALIRLQMQMMMMQRMTVMTRMARAIPPMRINFCWSRHQTFVPEEFMKHMKSKKY